LSQRRTKKRKSKPVSRPQPQCEQLFDIPQGPLPEPEIIPLREPIWTENKAKLIERYLFYFVMITKHGTYIDGFAGPQEPDKPQMWAAKLVLESNPRWFRNFYFFDAEESQVEALQKLKADQPSQPKRTIEIVHGDFNAKVLNLLSGQKIKMSEACFCLLDQRTFQCRWETLVHLARYKTSGNKIELFYFLPNHWFSRALSGHRDTTPVQQWWGREDWKTLYDIDASQRVEVIVRRFKKDLGYNSVKPWPIFERKDGGAIMYYMIHATDHPSAPHLMSRAYRKAVTPLEPIEQLKLDLAEFLT
jgi:three-Cys-motif partner protein